MSNVLPIPFNASMPAQPHYFRIVFFIQESVYRIFRFHKFCYVEKPEKGMPEFVKAVVSTLDVLKGIVYGYDFQYGEDIWPNIGDREKICILKVFPEEGFPEMTLRIDLRKSLTTGVDLFQKTAWVAMNFYTVQFSEMDAKKNKPMIQVPKGPLPPGPGK